MSSTTTYSLDQYKTDAQRQIEEKRRNSQQAANINYQKLQKYLPQQTKGYSIGMTETAKIAANNAYQRQLAEAESDYNADMTELNNYVRTEQERLDDKAKAEQDANYNEIMSSVRNGEYNTVADLDKYLGITTNENGDKVFGESSIAAGLSDTQQANLLNLYNTIAGDPEQKESDEAYETAKNTASTGIKTGDAVYNHGNSGAFGWFAAKDAGDNIEIKLPGADNEHLNVEYGEKIEDQEKDRIIGKYTATKGSKPKDGTVFGYDGVIYVYKDGVLWTVVGRQNSFEGDYEELYKHYFGETEE